MVDVTDLSFEGVKLLLLLAIAVLAISVALIGYFMSKRDNAITQATDNLTKAVDQLQIIVNGLQLQYQIRQPIIDERLNSHRDSIKDHEKRVTTLENEHKMYHCKFKEGEK
jgi:uncharacterized protein YoxC